MPWVRRGNIALRLAVGIIDKSWPSMGTRMDIWQAIKEDHGIVDSLFQEIQEDGGDRGNLFKQLKTALESHSQGEEKAVYPELARIAELKDLVDHSQQEHNKVRELLAKIEQATGDQWSELIDQLQDAVEDHVDEEEEQLIPVAQRQIEADKASAMLRAFEEAKERAMAELQ
jgi:hemerythrin superfamily protein